MNQLEFLLKNLPHLLIGFPGQRPGGLLLSIGLAIVAIGLGFVIALIVGSAERVGFRPISLLARGYTEAIRGLPLILLLVLIHSLLRVQPRTSALIALTLFSSAYQAEIVRAGLRAVPSGLIEASRTVGGSRLQTFRFIELRHAVRVMLPAFTGEAISLFKDTSVVIILGVAELMTVARFVLGSEVSNAPYWLGLYLLVGFLYFCVATLLAHLAQRMERRGSSAEFIQSLALYER